MAGEITTFAALPVGAYFMANGNACKKLSSRTARLLAYGRTFYFGNAETVTLGTPEMGATS